MRLVTYRARGETRDRVGVLEGEHVAEALGAASMLELLRRGLDTVRTGERTPLSEVRLRAPLPRPNSMRDFMLVEEHVLNSLGEVPAEWYEIPVYWKGNCDAVFGPEDEVPWPAYTEQARLRARGRRGDRPARLAGRPSRRPPAASPATRSSTTGARATSSSAR